MAAKKKSKSCSPCEIAQAMNITLDVCVIVSDKKKCEDLYERISSEKITPKKAIEEVKRLSKGNKKGLRVLSLAEKIISA
jgi:hypothetical protein